MLRLNFLTRSLLILGSSAIGWASWSPYSQASTLTNSEAFSGIYQFAGDSPNPTITGNGISFTPWQAGSGIKTNYVAGKPDRAFAGSGNWTTTSTPDANDYFQFSIAPTADYFFEITAIRFDGDRSATGPKNWQLNAQVGSQAPIVLRQGINSDSTWNSFTIEPTAALSNLTQAVTFTLYGYGATGNAGTWRIDNFSVAGEASVITAPQDPGSNTQVPEPDAVPIPLLLPALLGFGLKLRQRLGQATA